MRPRGGCWLEPALRARSISHPWESRHIRIYRFSNNYAKTSSGPRNPQTNIKEYQSTATTCVYNSLVFSLNDFFAFHFGRSGYRTGCPNNTSCMLCPWQSNPNEFWKHFSCSIRDGASSSYFCFSLPLIFLLSSLSLKFYLFSLVFVE